jgi:hypothetical protein
MDSHLPQTDPFSLVPTFKQNITLYQKFEQSVGGHRNRVGIGLSHRPAKLHRLAESNPWNRFPGSLKV